MQCEARASINSTIKPWYSGRTLLKKSLQLSARFAASFRFIRTNVFEPPAMAESCSNSRYQSDHLRTRSHALGSLRCAACCTHKMFCVACFNRSSGVTASSYMNVKFGAICFSSASTFKIVRQMMLSVGPIFTCMNASGNVRSSMTQKCFSFCIFARQLGHPRKALARHQVDQGKRECWLPKARDDK